MKKLALLSVLALLFASFAGCQLPAQTPSATIESTAAEEDWNITLPLTKNTAIQLALHHAGVPNEQVKHLHAWRDKDGGVYHYDVDFRHGEYYYAYEISESTGEILKLETEHDRTQLPQTQIPKEEAIRSATTNPAKQIGRPEIGAIAPGKLADFVVCTESLEKIAVYIGGKKLN
jgi:hypothetical protein